MKSIQTIILFGLILTQYYLSAQTQITSRYTNCGEHFELQKNPQYKQSGSYLRSFKYMIDVFGFKLYYQDNIDAGKMFHAATVTAQLLDNDDDGQVDDSALVAKLVEKEAFMPVFQQEGDEEQVGQEYNGEGVGAVLYKTEMDYSMGAGRFGKDATVEEILHTINGVGHANVYPSAFSFEEDSESEIFQAMDLARGGKFTEIPNPYPQNAWYTYDDETCDYSCMGTEYMYWAIVTNMGILDFEDSCQGISNEWRPCSKTQLETQDPTVYALINDSQYKIPTRKIQVCDQGSVPKIPEENTSQNSQIIYLSIFALTFALSLLL